MFTRNDLVDLIARHLSAAQAGPAAEAAPRGEQADAGAEEPRLAPMLPKGRLFLSEYDVKKRLTPDAQELKIPGETILSPLVSDWLVLKGIKIVRE